MPTLKEKPDWLRASTSGRVVGVDREQNVLRGYVVAQEGPFKSEGRGEFNVAGLKKLAALGNKATGGLKSRFTHPTLSSDGLGKFLGRAKNFTLDSVRVNRGGEMVLLHAVRADLHFDKTALDKPVDGGKPLAEYVMDLAESDPDALSSSVVVKADQQTQLDPKTKKPLLNDRGEALPPLWFPTELRASDIVDTGDAVDGLLSAEGLPDETVRRGTELLDKQFAGQSREVVKARAEAWLERYLTLRFGEPEAVDIPAPKPTGTSRSVIELRTILAERGAV